MSNFKIPDSVLAQHTAVLGKTGSGKSSTAKLMIEQAVAAGARVCVLDPIKSDWWGLTSSADGKNAGLPFHILGGPHGHVTVHESAGKAVGEIVASGTLPLSIIDMADFGPGGHAKFFNEFAPTLLRKMKGVVYLVLEEAHEFAPKERSGMDGENMLVYHAKKLATAGRSKGVRLILVTQRTQSLHNALLGSCDTMIAHRMTAPADQKPVVDWLKANTSKEITERVSSSLSSLPTGSAWLCSGEAKLFELTKFPRIHTYDNTATPTGDGAADLVKTAPVDTEKLRAIIGEAVATVAANDPAALKKRIAELERQVATKSISAPIDPEATSNAHRRGFAEGYAGGTSEIRNSMNDALNLSGEIGAEFMKRLRDLRDAMEKALDAPPAADSSKYGPVVPLVYGANRITVKVYPPTAKPAKKPNGHAVDSRISRPQQLILDQLLILNQREVYPPSRATLAAFCKVSPSSSGFEKNLSQLKTGGFIEYPQQGFVALTDMGDDAANPPNDDGRPAFDFWVDIVNSPKQEILRALMTEHPKAMSRGAIAQVAHVSPSSSGFEKNLSQLKTLGAIDYPMSGVVALSRYVMP